VSVRFEVEENNALVAQAEREFPAVGKASEILEAVAAEIGSEPAALQKELGVHDERDLDSVLHAAENEGRGLKVHRVCVDLHFETEREVHRFLSRQTWGDVHRFGCHHFHVPADACVNLELRDGSPTGPALNDRSEIGNFTGCRTVWMVKPGPEPNGAANGA
jgi:hypothetical protein